MAANSRKPSQIYPTSNTSLPPFMPPQILDPSIRGENFDQLLQNRGIRFIHKRAAPCPNLNKLADNSHNPMCPICNNNGFLFYDEREIYGVFVSNSLQKNFEQQGMWEIGSAVITFPSLYPDGSVAEFNTYDQLEINDFPVRLWELKEWNPGENNGVTRMRYPVDTIDIVTSVQNNVRIDFIEGTDFNIDTNGNLAWIVGREPSYNNTEEKGEVLSIVYHANPRYNVLQQMRELRITQQMINGQKTAIRLPQQILVKRDFLFNPPNTES